MPLSKVSLKSGVNREGTRYTNEDGWCYVLFDSVGDFDAGHRSAGNLIVEYSGQSKRRIM